MSLSSPGRINQSGTPKGNTCNLPPEKVFPIQIGSELFRLSGASIASDAPSYFSQFFEEQLENNEEGAAIRTLYIDRDPNTFQDILRHLQGYYIRPRDGAHFVKLFADSQFYSLPRLISQLFECEIFIQIGDRHFQIPRDIFSGPGDSPNFFSLGFAVFFASPGEVFPGLERKGLLRPPAITPPLISNRSGDVFAELLHMLRGYPIHIRDEEHRACLLRDCRYYHLQGLEQKLIPHQINYNLERRRSEITIRLEDVRPSGVSVVFQGPSSPGATTRQGGWVFYSRPFVDESPHEVVIEIGGDSTHVDLNVMRADFHGQTKARISSLCQVVANKMNLPSNTPLGLMMLSGAKGSQGVNSGNTSASASTGEERIKVHIDSSTDISLDGESYVHNGTPAPTPVPANNNIMPPTQSERDPQNSSGNEALSMPFNSGYTVMTDPKRPESMGYSPMTSRSPLEGGMTPLTPSPSMLYSRIQTPTGIQANQQLPRKRRREDGPDRPRHWVVSKGQWRLRVQPTAAAATTGPDSTGGGMELLLVAVKLEVYSGQRGRNAKRPFLG
ncbi:hypothetical protein FQN57_000215 [Myotisia sp. PD_48]|nr:hypothetical protein FQN57_000215 [Myotisia sp. PD_48]